MVRPKRNIQAAEFALGTLTTDERDEAAERFMRDPEFARASADWANLLAPLSETIEAVEPPAQLWPKLAAAIRSKARTEAAQPSDWIQQAESLRRLVAFWRTAAVGLAVTASILFAVFLFGGKALIGPGPEVAQATMRYVAMLRSNNGEPGFLVTVDYASQKLLIRPLGIKAPDSKSYELWLLKAKGRGAVTLGLVEGADTVKIDVPRDLGLREFVAGVQLAISLEPKGGAPSGQSMGKVVYAGGLIQQTP